MPEPSKMPEVAEQPGTYAGRFWPLYDQFSPIHVENSHTTLQPIWHDPHHDHIGSEQEAVGRNSFVNQDANNTYSLEEPDELVD